MFVNFRKRKLGVRDDDVVVGVMGCSWVVMVL